MFQTCRPCILMKPRVEVTFPTPSYKFVFAFVFISVATTDDLCPSICEQIQLAWFNDCPDLLGFCSLSKTEAREEMAHFGAFGLI